MNLNFVYIIFSFILLKSINICSQDYDHLIEAISFIKLQEENIAVQFGHNSGIIVEKGSGKNDNSVPAIFGDVLSLTFQDTSLSEERKKEFTDIFERKCNADIISFLIKTISFLFAKIKEIECKLKLLEARFKSCSRYGALMRRVKGCGQVEENYKKNKKNGRETLNRLTYFTDKVSECLSGITQGQWAVGIPDNSEVYQIECFEGELFNALYKIFSLKFYYQVLVVALASISDSASKCNSKCGCSKRLSKKCRCILSTVDLIESKMDKFEKLIKDRSGFVRGCTKYLYNTKGSISKDLMDLSVESNMDVKTEINQPDAVLTSNY